MPTLDQTWVCPGCGHPPGKDRHSLPTSGPGPGYSFQRTLGAAGRSLPGPPEMLSCLTAPPSDSCHCSAHFTEEAAGEQRGQVAPHGHTAGRGTAAVEDRLPLPPLDLWALGRSGANPGGSGGEAVPPFQDGNGPRAGTVQHGAPRRTANTPER